MTDGLHGSLFEQPPSASYAAPAKPGTKWNKPSGPNLHHPLATAVGSVISLGAASDVLCPLADDGLAVSVLHHSSSGDFKPGTVKTKTFGCSVTPARREVYPQRQSPSSVLVSQPYLSAFSFGPVSTPSGFPSLTAIRSHTSASF